jgi:hypothetical protein
MGKGRTSRQKVMAGFRRLVVRLDLMLAHPYMPIGAKLLGFSYINGDDMYKGLQEMVELLSYT